MFLLHVPSKLGIMLGKTMGAEWYKEPETGELERFYKYVFDKGPSDFRLLTEEGDWSYGGMENGFRKFDLHG